MTRKEKRELKEDFRQSMKEQAEKAKEISDGGKQ